MAAPARTHKLSDNDDSVPSMAYLANGLIWGNLLTKKALRTSIWLKMPMAPEHFLFMDANVMIFSGTQQARASFFELHIPIGNILAFHVLPPAPVEMDYDPNEPNRKFEAVTALVGPFRFDGNRRISVMADLATSLAKSGEKYSGLYDVTVTYPVPTMRALKLPFVLLRQDATFYGQ